MEEDNALRIEKYKGGFGGPGSSILEFLSRILIVHFVSIISSIQVMGFQIFNILCHLIMKKLTNEQRFKFIIEIVMCEKYASFCILPQQIRREAKPLHSDS